MLIQEAAFIGSKTREKLIKRGFTTTDSLVRLFPRKYKDYRQILSIKEALDKDCAITGTVTNVEVRVEAGREVLFMHLMETSTENPVFVKWFHTYTKDSVSALVGEEVVVCGKVEWNKFYGMREKVFYLVKNPDSVTKKDNFKGELKPVYRKMGTGINGISADTLKKIIDCIINVTEDPLRDTPQIAEEFGTYKEALKLVHNPKSQEDVEKGMARITMNDLIYFAIQTAKVRPTKREDSPYVVTNNDSVKDYIKSLPFDLTEDQRKVYMHCANTMHSKKRVSALIQGDVGCGKTLVAILLMLSIADSGYQAVLMAPTQVLAAQHFKELSAVAEKYGYKCAFLSSDLKAKEKNAVLKGIKNGEYQLVVGTHSTFSKSVVYKNLGLVITDEEHRFGVKQRTLLEEKAGEGAHLISMSATPIPRTVAETLYVGREILEIKTMPSNRKAVKSCVTNNLKGILATAKKELDKGRQVYVVCPAIENESEDEESTLATVKDTAALYEKYLSPFGYKVGIATSATKKAEKQKVEETLKAFKDGDIHILVATTVIEVGVNVPNSSLIVIRSAERFGGSTLHQLRGRVGRGEYEGFCVFETNDLENERLKLLVSTTDGFVIAKEDMKMRGAGSLLGEEQTGKNKYVDLALENPAEYVEAVKYVSILSDADILRMEILYDEEYLENKCKEKAAA